MIVEEEDRGWYFFFFFFDKQDIIFEIVERSFSFKPILVHFPKGETSNIRPFNETAKIRSQFCLG